VEQRRWARGSYGRETQKISDRGKQVCFGWSNKPERNSDRLTRQWWLWFPAAGHQTTPLTFGNMNDDEYENENQLDRRCSDWSSSRINSDLSRRFHRRCNELQPSTSGDWLGMHPMVVATDLCNQLLFSSAHITSSFPMEENYRFPSSRMFTGADGVDSTNSDGRMNAEPGSCGYVAPLRVNAPHR